MPHHAQNPEQPPRRPVAATIVTVIAAVVAALVASLLTALPAQAWFALPGGRANYVVSVIGGPVNATAVRLATYQFSRSGEVTQEAWSWRQNAIKGKGNVRWTKPASGYRTEGCRYTCPIRTPVGFQSGKRGRVAKGRFYVSGNVLVIKWGPRSSERWRIDTRAKNAAGLRLIARGTARGWGIGSHTSLSKAVDMRTLYQARRFYGPFAVNPYGSRTKFTHWGFSSNDNSLCRNGTCMQGKGNTSRNKRSWYSSYWAVNPAKDGRKVFRNHQTGVVQQKESRGSVCISGGGGHTDAMLQALDDKGRIIGLVGVEASLNQRKPGQAVVGAYAVVHPSVSSLVG